MAARSVKRSPEVRSHARTAGVIFTAAITGVISAGAIWAVATEPEAPTGMVVLAFFTGSVSLMMLASLRGHTDPWSVAELDGRPAWRLRLGPTRFLTVAVAVVLTATALGLGLGALSIAEQSMVGGVVVGALALGMLLLAVETSRVATRAPALLIGIDRLHHRGAGIDVELAWDDVSVIDWANQRSRWHSLRIGAAKDATTHRARTRFSLLPLDHVPKEPGIEIRTTLLSDAPAVMRLLRDLHIGDRPTREALIPRGTPSLPIR